jgi:hypothetical protein
VNFGYGREAVCVATECACCLYTLLVRNTVAAISRERGGICGVIVRDYVS